MRSEKIKTNSVTENKIDISSLPNGIYLLVIENGTDRVTKKIVVE